ncbi:MAG: DEAD/DEAH box helicase family protein [Candidatus Saganbacteria bacterium]|nr:DEAD/DEAH box helicase family protein [Candidatus Saganbacteria bacterium]
MSIICLKPFQETAIANLRKQLLELWKTGNRRSPLIFKSPTGSGKTVMVAQFLKDLCGDPQFDVDKAFLWFSFSEDSYEQSKKKLFNYYGGAGEVSLLDLKNLNRGKLEKNNVFFINWQKIKDSTKEGRKLRREGESTPKDLGLFDAFIKKTQEEGRELILIVDEAHRDTDTDLADELVELIDPRIILKITATPKNEPSASDVMHKRAGFVDVLREDVVEAGLIKEKIITQTKEDIEKLEKKEIDQDKMLLELAFAKRLELKNAYKELGLDINPLVLIQLPNDDQARRETLDKSKEDIVKEYLKSKKVDEGHIAVWLSEKKENLDDIEQNSSDVCFLIFKQAAATGWDCPRASILVMYREIKSPVFHTQTVGRILRMPEAIHYGKPELNIGYLYTNYERNQIQLPDNKLGENKPFIYQSVRRPKIKPMTLQSVFMGRTDYNDLGDSFQNIFLDIADKYFSLSKRADFMIAKIKDKMRVKGLEIEEAKVKNKLIVDAEIEDYDNFVKEIRDKGQDLNEETSRNDIERMYNLLCFNIIAKQEEENRRFAPERSWGKLKTALNVWFGERTEEKRIKYYTIIVNDLLKPDSILRKIIGDALEAYRPIRQEEVKTRESRAKRTEELGIPRGFLFYTDDYEKMSDVKKCAMEPFYIGKSYVGRDNETKFIEYIEAKKDIEWWYKNGSTGSENFSIPYYDKTGRKERLFYPDWIIKLKGKIIIIDTKLGQTASSSETKDKAAALQEWIKDQNKKSMKFDGGIAVRVSDVWRINNNQAYSYDASYSGWTALDDLF